MSEKVKIIPQFLNHDQLEVMLPHRGKMFLLSRSTAHDTDNHTLTAETDITPDCIFYDADADGVPSWAGFEFLAQGISALTGITNTEKGRTPLPRFILSVMEFKADVDYFKNGTTVQMKVSEDFRDEENHVYRYICSLYTEVDAAEPKVTAKISVMETEDAEALFGNN